MAGLIFSGLQPCWVRPQWDARLHIAHPPVAGADRRGLGPLSPRRGRADRKPDPYGTCADIAAIAEICHERGRPLIVDEAWGAHLPFHDQLPTWAMDADADICVVSVHKMGTGFEQGSVFHVQGDLVDSSAPVRVR